MGARFAKQRKGMFAIVRPATRSASTDASTLHSKSTESRCTTAQTVEIMVSSGDDQASEGMIVFQPAIMACVDNMVCQLRLPTSQCNCTSALCMSFALESRIIQPIVDCTRKGNFNPQPSRISKSATSAEGGAEGCRATEKGKGAAAELLYPLAPTTARICVSTLR